MSRNLCQTTCYFCNSEIICEELPRELTKSEANFYYADLEGLLVANAYCPLCEAKYLAWINEDRVMVRRLHGRHSDRYGGPIDLSFRSTFNDEPGEKDMPKYDIEVIKLRKPRKENK